MKRFKSKYFKWAIFLLIICFTLGMATVSFAKFVDRYWYKTEGRQSGGHLDFASNTTPNNLDPHLATTGDGGRNSYFNGLIRVTPRMDGIELDLAESWEQLDALPEGRFAAVILRAGRLLGKEQGDQQNNPHCDRKK